MNTEEHSPAEPEIRSSKSETNPNCQEWGNGQTESRDVSSQAASNLDYCSTDSAGEVWAFSGSVPDHRSMRGASPWERALGNNSHRCLTMSIGGGSG